MNNASELIDSLWKAGDNLKIFHDRLKREIDGRSPAIAGIIGRELLLRARTLSSSEFAIAAYLASEGEAGNDSLEDFIDCVSILPFDRYLKITNDHEALADDPVRTEFEEFGFYKIFENRFESIFGEEGDGLLSHLVFGDITLRPQGDANLDPKSLFPQLFERFGMCFVRKPAKESFSEKATLDDFFG